MVRDEILAVLAAAPNTTRHDLVMQLGKPDRVTSCLRHMRAAGVVIMNSMFRYSLPHAPKPKPAYSGAPLALIAPPPAALPKTNLAAAKLMEPAAPAPRYEPSSFIAPIARARLMAGR